jgi:hypothetical protein
MHLAVSMGGAQMSRILLAIVVVLVSSAVHAACLTTPDLRDHRGYWRYHVNLRTGQRCWYQSALGRAHARAALLQHASDTVPLPPERPIEQPVAEPPKPSRIDDTFDAMDAQPWRGLIQMPAAPQQTELLSGSSGQARTVAVHANPANQTSNDGLLPLLAAPGAALFLVMAMYGLLKRYGDRWLAHS